jgi:transposase
VPLATGELVSWLGELDGEVMVGIEGAGSYGAGLCRHLQAVGISVVEVERPRRRDRRQGKSDRVDALLAAKRVLAGDGVSTPRADGNRASLSVLLVAYRSCVEERTRLLNQLQGLHVTAPTPLRERIGATATERGWLIAWCGCATGPERVPTRKRC